MHIADESVSYGESAFYTPKTDEFDSADDIQADDTVSDVKHKVLVVSMYPNPPPNPPTFDCESERVFVPTRKKCEQCHYK